MSVKNQMAVCKCQIILILIGALLCVFSANAQQSLKPYVLSWTEKDGLSDNIVTTVLKDQKGLLWVGTNSGLCRFDGNDFEVFQSGTKNEISSFDVECIRETKNGKIWAGSDGGGISIFNYEKNEFQQFKQNKNDQANSLMGDRIYSFLKIDTNRVLVSYRLLGSSIGGLSIVDEEMNIIEHVLQNKINSLGSNLEITNLIQDSQDKNVIWLGGRDLFRWNMKTGDFQIFPYLKFISRITHFSGLEEVSDSTLLIGLDYHGVFLFDKKNKKWIEKVHEKGVRTLAKDQNGQIWLNDSEGVGWLDIENKKVHYELLMKGEQSPFPEKISILNFTIIENKFWIATNKGLFYWDPIVKQFRPEKIKVGENEWAHLPEFVAQLNLNEWVFIDKKRGLIITDSLMQMKRIIRMPQKTFHLKAIFIAHASDPFFILGGGEGLFRWNINEAEIKPFILEHPFLKIEDIEVWSFFMDENKNLWVGTRVNGLLKIDLETEQIIQFLHDPNNAKSLSHNRYLFAIEGDQNENIWIGTDKGLSVIDPRTNEFISYPELSEIQNYVFHFIEKDDFGNIWAGSRDNGLFKFELEKRKLKNMTIDDGLPYNGVNKLLAIDSTLWMSTRKGLVKMNVKTEECVTFDQKKGLSFNHLYDSRLKKLPNEKVMLTYQYSDFYTTFDPFNLVEYFGTPELAVNSLRVLSGNENKTIITSNNSSVDLNANENYIIINYQAVDFVQPRGIRYEYQLENYDENWIQAGKNNNATYTNLPGGDYIFKVKASNQDGLWSEIEKVTIHLQTPWYKTNWFYLLSLLLTSGIIYGIYKNRTNQIRREENFKRQLAETEMKALRAQINPHFIFNCLNSIKSYIIENRIEDGTEFVGRFAQLIRMILNHSKEKLVPFSKEIKAIRLYTWLEQERLKQKFKVDFELKFDNSEDDLMIPPLLFQPYIENAIWHGLLHLPDNGNLKIIIEELEETISIQIIDDGIGRAAAAEIKRKSVFNKPSLGLDLAMKRLEQIDKLYQIKTTVTIEDQFPTQKNTGTIVKIIFPKIKNQANESHNN